MEQCSYDLLPKWKSKIPPQHKDLNKVVFRYKIYKIFPFHLSVVMSIYLVTCNSSDNHEIPIQPFNVNKDKSVKYGIAIPDFLQ